MRDYILPPVFLPLSSGNIEGVIHKEVNSYRDVFVKIVEGKNLQEGDLFSKGDFFVSLWLPTASLKTYRTRTIPNSSNPIWNESFHFQIHNQVKNILELSVYDEDKFNNDCVARLLLDVDKIPPGTTISDSISLIPEGSEVLLFELRAEERPDLLGEITTNGVLVTRPFSCIEISVLENENKTYLNDDERLSLKLSGAYEEMHKWNTPHNKEEHFHFHATADMELELEVNLTKVAGKSKTDSRNKQENEEDEEENEELIGTTTVPIHLLKENQDKTVRVAFGKERSVDLKLRAKECSEDLDIRLGFDISEHEKHFLKKRKKIVSETIRDALSLTNNLEENEVPVVAVVGSGGGMRAMTSLYGSLSGLQKLKLLDCVTYIVGVSGSTWCMSNLYENPKWSQENLQTAIHRAQDQVCHSKMGFFSAERLNYYSREIKKRTARGQTVSFSDIWGLIIEYLIHGKENTAKLSDQQKGVEEGQNAYPIYTAVNVKEDVHFQELAEWCEFTPHEVGFPKYGAFIRAEDFGSEFFMGRLMKSNPESRICYLQGLWSSIFSVSLADVWQLATGSSSAPGWLKNMFDNNDEFTDLSKITSSKFVTSLTSPEGLFSHFLEEALISRPAVGENYNFLKGFHMHRDYRQHGGFIAWMGTDEEDNPNYLTPAEKKLHLVDAGFSINTGFPPLFRPERQVDVILSFNYTWGSQFKALKQTEEYCAARNIPFPKVNLHGIDNSNLKECYLFVDEENPQSPIVLHFPLVNDTFRTYKAPGIKRNSVKEKTNGSIDVQSRGSPYRTAYVSYSVDDFSQLVNLNCYNVMNQKEIIMQAINMALHRKRQSKPQAIS
ncbi:cytosolic phospholipase A2 zeta-like [Protopterus annectens]|uniref:cytosolic phospholipase A2 zeta-like n=1 Tax=Protopterus annectens TaxID=7888 RepID=UPI001CFC3A9F|nr:cytosolic phospholipase A2 zeta-like [Protopterus annectens]